MNSTNEEEKPFPEFPEPGRAEMHAAAAAAEFLAVLEARLMTDQPPTP